jgi:hypothetical protein
MSTTRPLDDILDGPVPDDDDGPPAVTTEDSAPTAASGSGSGSGTGAGNGPPRDGSVMCVECEDMPATVFCQGCREPSCDVCFRMLHRKGTRALHGTTRLDGKEDDAPVAGAVGGFFGASPGGFFFFFFFVFFAAICMKKSSARGHFGFPFF